MKAAGVILLVAIAVTASGCGSSRRADAATTDAQQLRVSGNSPPAGLVKELDAIRRAQGSGKAPAILKATVYGPDSRRALVEASSGAWVPESAQERQERFYLIVVHGHFVAASHPAGTKAPRGTIETQVWSTKGGVTDVGIVNRLPASVFRLPEFATITLS